MRVKWDNVGERFYETGLDHGVLYVQKDSGYPLGVPWSGLTSMNENPSGAEDNAIYADNMKYLNMKSAEDFAATLGCYYYPDEFAACNGEKELIPGITLGQQARKTFGLSYRTKVGNDTQGDDYGYKLHMVYGCSATPSQRAYNTTNESPEANELSFEISTTAIPIDGVDEDGKSFRPVATIVADSTKLDKATMKKLEDILWGSDEGEGTDPRLPLPSELAELLTEG